MATYLVKLSVIALLVIVILSAVVALNQLANNPPGSPLSNPTPTLTPVPTILPSLSPTITSNPTSTDSLPKTPTPKPTSTPTSPTYTPTTNTQPTSIPTQSVQPTPMPTVASTVTPTTQPTPTQSQPFTVNFDFDTASPVGSPSMNTPLSQTNGGITAQFSSPSDPAAFSIQNSDTTLYKLSEFTGSYLSDNKPTRDTLDIRFSASLTSLTFTFATFEYHGAQTSQPSYILMTSYLDSTSNLIGSTTARGTWPSGGNAFPQGTLTYTSTNPFNFIRIELPFQSQQGSVDYLIDTIIVTTY
jgi:hypothetical protein